MLKREETLMDEDKMSSEGYEVDGEVIQNQWLITEANELGGPSARAGHSLVSFSGRLYLFGGFCNVASYLSAHAHMGDPALREINQNAMPHFNSVHEYSFETRSWRVLHQGTLEHTPSVPKARRHASVVAHGNSLFVYGGFDADDKVLSDLWEFNIMQCTWERVKYSQFARALPPVARAEHTAVVYENKMIVFGGYDGKKKLNDTFVYDFAAKEWSRPPNAEHGAPSRRCKHTAVLYNSHMYVLGGFQFNNGDNYALTDMHHLDLETYVWSSVLMNKGSPEALQGHKAVVCGDVMYVLGGKVRAVGFGPNADVRSSGLNQSVFRYHFDTYKWSELPLTGTLPTPRQLHAAVTVNRGNGRSSILVFGGTDKAKQAYFRDLCELRGIRNTNELDHLPCANCISTRRLLNKELFSDVHFLVEEKKVYAHRCILYARSEYFRTMFESNMRESSLLEIPIPGVTYDTFLAVMEYLYACRVSVTDGRLAVELLKAADMFRLEGLRAHCVKKVEKAVTVENVAFVCEIADTHNAEHLKQYCFTFIMRNFKRVINSDSWQSLLRQDPGGLGREILEAYSDSNPYLGSAHKRARK